MKEELLKRQEELKKEIELSIASEGKLTEELKQTESNTLQLVGRYNEINRLVKELEAKEVKK